MSESAGCARNQTVKGRKPGNCVVYDALREPAQQAPALADLRLFTGLGARMSANRRSLAWSFTHHRAGKWRAHRAHCAATGHNAGGIQAGS
ncbi:hypothetical protein C7S18_09085 [Ahniella affigens]|uniref:Uncharacterized protein n=1 Tax=Ahniella affigens TaxID=2021234 RepID=A0A2P1PR58_9GAMM|nr:hypothetical protein C7S18_09085 [Ahniella affigens]